MHPLQHVNTLFRGFMEDPYHTGTILRKRAGKERLGRVLGLNLIGRVVEASSIIDLLTGYTGVEPCDAYANLSSGFIRIAYCRPRLEVEIRGLITYYIISKRGLRTAKPEGLVDMGVCTPGLTTCALGGVVDGGVVFAMVRVDGIGIH